MCCQSKGIGASQKYAASTECQHDKNLALSTQVSVYHDVRISSVDEQGLLREVENIDSFRYLISYRVEG